jgi:hypothetical protein
MVRNTDKTTQSQVTLNIHSHSWMNHARVGSSSCSLQVGTCSLLHEFAADHRSLD